MTMIDIFAALAGAVTALLMVALFFALRYEFGKYRFFTRRD